MTTNTSLSAISTILQRDLKKTISEIELYRDESTLWIKEGTIQNSSGNLALHIAGAIQHFIGAMLGKDGYQRDREKEFAVSSLPKSEIIGQLNRAYEVVFQVLENIAEEDTCGEFPEKIGGKTLTTDFFLIQLVSHVNYHLGQINYHRRILDGKNV